MKDVANLAPIAIDCDRLAADGLNHEMRKPALVLVSELPRPINAAHPQNRRPQSIDARIVADILIGGALRTPVRTIEIQASGLADAALEPFVERDVAIADTCHV